MSAPATAPADPVLRVRDLKVHFRKPGSIFQPGAAGATIYAVDGVSLVIDRGETLGLVGESGCGKSTVAKAILRLLKPTSGEIVLSGHDLAGMSQRELRPLRPKVQIVFQDPSSSLNPRMTVAMLLREPLSLAGVTRAAADARIAELLRLVGLPADFTHHFPHQLSGGQRQRLVIARALALAPEIVVCDEPVSALDVSVQAQILNLLKDVQDQLGVGYLFVCHDLGVLRQIADRVAVMYLGRIVEEANAADIFARPLHPYTQALLSAAPAASPDSLSPRVILQGELPSPSAPPSGCRFRTRCPAAQPICAQETPELRSLGPHHRAACHFAGEVDLLASRVAALPTARAAALTAASQQEPSS